MTRATVDRPVRNPFCTRAVRPGLIPPFDGCGRPVDCSALVLRLEERGGSASIVGPHGSGKTTLLRHAAATLKARGNRVEWVRLHGGRDLVALVVAVMRAAGGGIVCVDSWERLGRPWADVFRWYAQACGARLLVTAHRPVVMPTLWTCHTSPALLDSIVTHLPDEEGFMSDDRPRLIEEAFERSAGDIREALFMLYDRFEERARAARPIDTPRA